MSTRHSTKTVDAACGTTNWMNLSWEEIDKYLDYDNYEDSLPTQILKTARVAASPKPRVYALGATVKGKRLRVRTTGGKIDFRIRDTQSVVTGEQRLTCLSHVYDQTNRSSLWVSDSVINSEIHLKNHFLFGRTSSPLMNYLVGERTPCTIEQTYYPDQWAGVVGEMTAYILGLFECKLDLRGYPKLRRLHSKSLRSFGGASFLRFMTCVAHIALSLKPWVSCPVIETIIVLSEIERAFGDKPVVNGDHSDPLSGFEVPSLCNGTAIIASPGTGKTQFLNGFHLGFIDTDYLNVEAMNKDPTIMGRLLSYGISVFTNRWEWRQWSVAPIYIKAHDMVSRLIAKTKPTLEMRALSAAKREALLSRRRELRQREWVEAYTGLDEYTLTIHLGEGQCLLHGYGVLLDHLLTMRMV